MIVAVNAPTFENSKFDVIVGKDVMKQFPSLVFDLSSGRVTVGRTNCDLRGMEKLNKEGKGGNASHTKTEGVFIEDYLFTESPQSVGKDNADSSTIRENTKGTDVDQTTKVCKMEEIEESSLGTNGEKSLKVQGQKEHQDVKKTRTQKKLEVWRAKKKALKVGTKEVRPKAMGQINPEAGGSKSPIGAC